MLRRRTELRQTARSLALGLAAWSLAGSAAGVPAPADAVPGYKVTIHQVWASDEPPSGEFPKEIKKFRKQLEKTTRKKSFRLEKKPASAEVREGKPLGLTLPGGYELRFEFHSESSATALRQVLVNPKKEKSALLLKKSPVITVIEKVRRGSETFLVLVEFEALKK